MLGGRRHYIKLTVTPSKNVSLSMTPVKNLSLVMSTEGKMVIRAFSVDFEEDVLV